VTSEHILLNNFKDLSKDLESLLDKTTDIILDSYTGTPTEASALKYLNQIKKLSKEIEDKMSEDKVTQTKEGLSTLDEVEKLIKKRNNLLKQLGIIV
jgi:ElaB/YqjD/DUF883 family membrane-anchored ribosome-binding protein